MPDSQKLLFRAEGYPVFQNRMYDSPEEGKNCPKGDITLVQDQATGLVFNAAFRPELMEYDRHYQNEQAVSRSFQRHLEDVSQIVTQRLGKDDLIEIGCGKAYFLELLAQQACHITGFDPTYEGNNSAVRKAYFDEGCGLHAEGLILRHVLEHVPDPVSFLRSIKAANGGRGRIYIEVPCFDWICQHKAWFDVFYEHVNYFRLSDLKRMFGEVVESGVIFGGQYLYIVAELSSLKTPKFDHADPVPFPSDFFEALSLDDSQPVCVWGGASKGVIFSLLCERAGFSVSLVIDVNPAKQGKYLPGTGLKVESPEEALKRLPPGAKIYVMNSNYLEEIKAISGNAYQYIGVDQ